MGDKDPRLNERLNRFYDHIEGEMPPASLEHFDSDAAGRRARVVHLWAGVAGVAAVAAAIGGLAFGLASHRTGPLPAPATSHSPSAPAASSSPNPSSSPSASAFANFQPVAFSAISESQYWVLGNSGNDQPVLLHTLDGGQTFQQIPSPPAALFQANGTQSVMGIRFADASDGYVYGSALWATHDGGAHWHQVTIGGSVPQLEPGAGGFVYAIVRHCPAAGGSCASTVERSIASGDAWSTLALPSHSSGTSEAIGVHGTSLWVMQFGTGKLYVSRDAGASFSAETFPCVPELDGSIDPVSDSVIWAFCPTGMQGGVAVSSDGGHTWMSHQGGFSNGGIVAGLSATNAFVSDASSALRVTHNGGASFSTILNWQPTSGFWVGFTDASVGYAVVAGPNASGMQLWRTTDGGTHWAQVTFAG